MVPKLMSDSAKKKSGIEQHLAIQGPFYSLPKNHPTTLLFLTQSRMVGIAQSAARNSFTGGFLLLFKCIQIHAKYMFTLIQSDYPNPCVLLCLLPMPYTFQYIAPDWVRWGRVQLHSASLVSCWAELSLEQPEGENHAVKPSCWAELLVSCWAELFLEQPEEENHAVKPSCWAELSIKSMENVELSKYSFFLFYFNNSQK